MMVDFLSFGAYGNDYWLELADMDDVPSDGTIANMKTPAHLLNFALKYMPAGTDKTEADQTLWRIVTEHLQKWQHPDTRPDYDGIVRLLDTFRGIVSRR